MKKLKSSPILVSLIAFIVLIIIAFGFSIPMYDSELHYFSGSVDFNVKAKVSLRHLLGIDLTDFRSNTLIPEVKLTTKGIFILIIIHLGLPSLLYIRFQAAKKRNELNEE
jgi:hypothetical protein